MGQNPVDWENDKLKRRKKLWAGPKMPKEWSKKEWMFEEKIIDNGRLPSPEPRIGVCRGKGLRTAGG